MTPKDIENIHYSAFHESGHIVMAYMVNWSVKNVKIVFNGDLFKNAVTTYDYGDDDTYINLIMNFQYNITLYNSYTQNLKEYCIDVAERRLRTIWGGPTAEKRYLMGSQYNGTWIIDENFIRSKDYQFALEIQNFLIKCKTNYETNFFENNIKMIAKSMKLDNIWRPIKILANELISSDNYNLDNSQIEDILKSTGYFNYLDRIRNANN